MSCAQQADAGTTGVDGRPVRTQAPLAALRLGITGRYQEFGLVPARSDPGNVLLGLERVAWARHVKALSISILRQEQIPAHAAG